MKQLFVTIITAIATMGFANAQEVKINVDANARCQQIEGWGTSLCWWAHMCGQWENEAAIDQLVDMIIGYDELNMNIFRYNMGGGDDPSHIDGHMTKGKGKRAEMPGFKDGPDKPYNWNADAGQRKIMLKIKQRRPDAVFEAFSNSAPYWMTISGCSGGNGDGSIDNLRPEYYDAFCEYLLDVCRFYRDQYGITFKTLEPFNESTSSYWNYLGSQEGCHFDVESQIAVLRKLYPMLQKSGLSTVLSASDETSLTATIKVLESYMATPDVIKMLGQFNTHTYSGTNAERARLHSMIEGCKLPFWQSETGPQWDDELKPKGNSSFESNLYLAKKMFADLKIMQPQAWLDWQMVEEGNETWCLFRGNFATGEFKRVKNYYVRMNVTRFIRQGYTIINTDSSNTLAAVSPEGDKVVVVALNLEENGHKANISLNGFGKPGKKAKVYRTSATEDCAELKDAKISSGRIATTLVPMSITTYVIPIK